MAGLTPGPPSRNETHASIGLQGMWGFSPALDLLHTSGLSAAASTSSPPSSSDPINILLVSACDVRHVLRTLAARRRHTSLASRPLHFYLLDNPTEVLSRHLLLLYTLTDWEIPIRQRAILFLELYGNCLLQDRTARYMDNAASDLIRLVCDQPSALTDMISLQHLKFRDRDAMESTFKSWSVDVPYDLEGLRDTRLRHFYGERYDAKKNVLDWDYQSRVKVAPAGASIIHIKQYREWRNSGIAFEFGDATYNQPNRSMSSYTPGFMKAGKNQGMKKDVRGFWLDIVVSPYPSFGVSWESPNKFSEDLGLVLNKGTGTEQHRHHTVEVSTYNLMSYLWEIETGAAYTMTKKEDIFSGLGEDASDYVAYSKAVSPPDEAPPDEKKEPEAETPLEEVAAEAAKAEAAKAEAAKEEAAQKAKEVAAEEARKEKEERMEKKRLRQAASRARNIIETLENVTVFPLSGQIGEMYGKNKFEGLFDIVYASQHGSHNVKEEQFKSLLKPDARLVMESGKHVYAVGAKQLPELNKLMLNVVEEGGGWDFVNGDAKDEQGLLDLENFVFKRSS
ncbi:hypothetical protein TeGR_g10973 [Tetraparma gracilis]|uniref:Dynein assembly factor 3, axonemal n=1 Tax=Tetraparma gracilis TaxID=2962635 RepID=A0ABQ6MFM0_9STRA|nr:hypothetical protein TeGR_g10973 [Tetraparma gracilis]